MAWIAIITLILKALTDTWEMLTARNKVVVIRFDAIVYLWSAWYIYSHM